jgi:glycosyltransferase involved in cell wall biosynthesis
MPTRKAISIVLPDVRAGGAERLHINLANEWAARGLAVELVLLRAHGELLPLLGPKVSVAPLGVNRIRSAIVPLAAYLRRTRPQVVLAAMWPLTSASVLAWILAGKRSRIYVSDHNQLSLSCVQELGVSLRYLKTSMRFTYRIANGVIAVSRGVKDDVCRLGMLVDSQVKVIWNPAATGVSPHRIEQSECERLWGSGFSRRILSVGVLKPQKDHETLIRAFARIPQNQATKLVILGEGPMRAKLLALVKELDLQEHVSLPGFVSDPFPWLRSADLFVLSSRWEGFGNVLVEALECGVPIVSTNCLSGPAEILENGRYGKLVPVRDPEALAAAMVQSLAETHDQALLMSRAREFTVSKISEQYLAYMFPDGV